MKLKLSATQQQVLQRLQADPTGQLRRYPGGFWTTPGTPLPGGTPISQAFEYEARQHGAPEWWVSMQTVHALEKLKLLTRTQEFPEDWRDTRVLGPGKI